jgi:hypothetical protein
MSTNEIWNDKKKLNLTQDSFDFQVIPGLRLRSGRGGTSIREVGISNSGVAGIGKFSRDRRLLTRPAQGSHALAALVKASIASIRRGKTKK